MKEEILKNKRFNEVYTLYRTKLNLKDNDKVFEYFLCDLFLLNKTHFNIKKISISGFNKSYMEGTSKFHIRVYYKIEYKKDYIDEESSIVLIDFNDYISSIIEHKLNKLESWINKHF